MVPLVVLIWCIKIVTVHATYVPAQLLPDLQNSTAAATVHVWRHVMIIHVMMHIVCAMLVILEVDAKP